MLTLSMSALAGPRIGVALNGWRQLTSEAWLGCRYSVALKFLLVYPVVERRRPAATRGWTPQRFWRARREGKDRRGQPHRPLDGGD
jgi:hypothetical protein